MANPESATPAHLNPSALGTKEYWDTLYETELANHADNPSDEGTVWFDEADAEARMVQFLDELESGESESEQFASDTKLLALDRARAAVLDLGCGNGSLLFALRDDGWVGRLLGVDYSATSVRLARAVGESRGVGSGEARGGEEDTAERESGQQPESSTGGEDNEDEEDDGAKEVEFKVWDVLNGGLDEVRATTGTDNDSAAAGWDVVLDKGTFDAVSLSGERDAQGRRVCEGYGARVVRLLRTGGIFLVTSCNWTEEELRGWFDGKTEQSGGSGGEDDNGRGKLRLAGRIAYPSFSFGGVKGQTISTLCFQKLAA